MINDCEVGTRLGRNFLEAVDRFLKDNYSTLGCKDVYDIYFQFSDDLKNFKGNSNGFTGFSEFLIFRILYHHFGSLLEKEDKTKYLSWFSYKSIRIGQSIPVPIDNKKVLPDIVIYRSGKLVAVVQIKIYPTKGREEIKKEIDLLRDLKRLNPELKALLLIYYVSTKGEAFKKLQREKEDKSWFDFVILKDNNEPLAEKLRKSLMLDHLLCAPLK